MYKILLWQLKLVFTISIFAIKIKLLKNHQKCFLLYQESSFCPQIFSNFCTSLFLFFFPFLAIADIIEVNLDIIIIPLCYHYVIITIYP